MGFSREALGPRYDTINEQRIAKIRETSKVAHNTPEMKEFYRTRSQRVWDELRADSRRLELRNARIRTNAARGERSPRFGKPAWNRGIPYSTICKGKRRKRFYGTSEYGVSFTYSLKRCVWERDGHRCRWCGVEGRAGARKLVVHHINGCKGDCRLENLMLLCRSCHAFLHGLTNGSKLSMDLSHARITDLSA